MTYTLSESLTARPATVDDAEAVAELINVCAVAERGAPSTDVSALREGEDLSTQSLGDNER
jgi:hypothetical protein